MCSACRIVFEEAVFVIVRMILLGLLAKDAYPYEGLRTYEDSLEEDGSND